MTKTSKLCSFSFSSLTSINTVVGINKHKLWLLVLARPSVVVACGKSWQIHNNEVQHDGGLGERRE